MFPDLRPALRPALRVAALLVLAVAAACSGGGDKEFAYVERPAENLYADAAEALERRRFDRAIPLFEEVERQHPYSAWARRAMLMKAFARYQQNDYDEAVTALDQFIALHPGNKDIPYAYYLRSMCFYERIRDVGRDQDYTNQAVTALTDVIRRFPQTEYARDARLKLDLTQDHLAGKEMYVGRFYLRQGKYIAAVNRFKTVVEDYETTSHVPEALHRLVETYLQLGVVDEARQVAAVLGYNYPGSNWYEFSYDLLEDVGVLEPGARPKAAFLRKSRTAEDDQDDEEKLKRAIDLDGVTGPNIDESDIGNNAPVPTDNPLPR